MIGGSKIEKNGTHDPDHAH